MPRVMTHAVSQSRRVCRVACMSSRSHIPCVSYHDVLSPSPCSKHRQIKKTRIENRLLKQVWDMISIVAHQFADWKKTLWDKIDTDLLLVACKKIQRQIQTEFPSEVHGWDCYQGLMGEVNNFLTVLPLVNLLHSPAMEDRHWTELKLLTNKAFHKDHAFCLSNLLDLELHHHVMDVEYIVELATKEAKIATQLKKIQQLWSGLVSGGMDAWAVRMATHVACWA